MLSLALVLLAAAPFAATAASAAAPVACRVKNVTLDSQPNARLAQAIDAAKPGDKLRIHGVCRGNFVIRKNLKLVSHSLDGTALATLDGRANGTPVIKVTELTAAGHQPNVVIRNIAVTNGFNPAGGAGGGGILNFGDLTLKRWTSVSGNQAQYAGGISNYGVVTLNGHTTVSNNSANAGAGGVDNSFEYDGLLVMNDYSSVANNTSGSGGGGIWSDGSLVMNDSSSVTGNSIRPGGVWSKGGGIYGIGSVTMSGHATVSGNSAESGGGVEVGYREDDGLGSILLKDHASVIDNTATIGGGLYAPSPAFVAACDEASLGYWTGLLSPNATDDPPDVARVACD
ncbi:MAG: hypothetical protein LH645_11120 [Actinomycetia bacterium]|nr:hypothetical protein [Actinomycetes bacterium]